MRIVTILGTTRPGNYTGKALAIVQDELEKRDGVEHIFVDPSKLQLSFPGHPNESGDAKRMQDMVKDADAVILATPEYHGTYAAALKLVVENLGFPSVLKGKPIGMVGVAGGRIGAIKSLHQLMGMCNHVGAIVLPGQVSVASVNRSFDADGNCTDEGIEKRLRGLANAVADYVSKTTCPTECLETSIRS